MPDQPVHSIPLHTLIEHLGGQLIGDGEQRVDGFAPLEQASASHISFLTNPKFIEHAAKTQAAALILTAKDHAALGESYQGARIIVDDAYLYFARAAQLFAKLNWPKPAPACHPSAVIDPSSSVAPTATIAAGVIIEAEAIIGEHVVIDAACVIGRGCHIGAHSHLYPRVTIYHRCHIGQRCLIHAGVVIGADGFGFANDAGTWVKIPQTGRVVIGDDVDIGANTTIDRGTLTDTVIENGVKLDNQIQIAHNCHIGAHTAIAACVGIAGSTTIGRHCIIGGAAMIQGHITLADHVHISAGTPVLSSIITPGRYTGLYPIAAHKDWEKSAALVRHLRSLRERIRALEKVTSPIHECTDEPPSLQPTQHP